MSFALEIVPAFKVFHDKGANPKPLEGGYIYIGTPGLDPETNPANAYWDIARTKLATQPIRTIGGRPDRNGSAAAIYSEEDYSITVRNSAGELVYTSLNNYTNELNKFYYFDSIADLKAATTSGLLGQRVIVMTGNGAGNPDDGLDHYGGFFKRIPGIGTASTEGINSDNEYIVTDANGVQFKLISKLQEGSHIGRNGIIERSDTAGKSTGFITLDGAETKLQGWFMSPNAQLTDVGANYAYQRYFFDPYHKTPGDYRALQIGAQSIAGTPDERYYHIHSFGEGSFDDSPPHIKIECGNSSQLIIDKEKAGHKRPSATQPAVILGDKNNYGLTHYLTFPTYDPDKPYQMVRVSNYNLPVGANGGDAGITWQYKAYDGTTYENYDLLELKRNNGFLYNSDKSNFALHIHVPPVLEAVDIAGPHVGSPNSLDSSVAAAVYQDIGDLSVYPVYNIINGREGQELTIYCRSDTGGRVDIFGTNNVDGHTSNIIMNAPKIIIDGSGTVAGRSAVIKLICIKAGAGETWAVI